MRTPGGGVMSTLATPAISEAAKVEEVERNSIRGSAKKGKRLTMNNEGRTFLSKFFMPATPFIVHRSAFIVLFYCVSNRISFKRVSGSEKSNTSGLAGS